MIWWSVRYYTALLVWLFWFEVAERTAAIKDNRRESLAWLRVLELRRERRRARGFRIDR